MRDSFCLVVDGDAWHRGVIGIAATRVVERYGRPALVLSREDGEAYGSGRSIPAFHLLDALESCRDMFTRFGGHAHAVGFSLPCDRVPALRAALDTYARERLTPADFERVLDIRRRVAAQRGHDHVLRMLAAPGAVRDEQSRAGVRGPRRPRRLPAENPEREAREDAADQRRWENYVRGIEALGWRMAEQVQQAGILAGDMVDVAFTLEVNDHPEFGGLELRLEDVIKVAQAQSASAVSR